MIDKLIIYTYNSHIEYLLIPRTSRQNLTLSLNFLFFFSYITRVRDYKVKKEWK
jgi:hypothetical protein